MRTGPGTPGHYRLRYDTIDTTGKISFRRAGRMHHLGIGATHAGKRVLAIADDTTVTVIELHTGEILATSFEFGEPAESVEIGDGVRVAIERAVG